MFLDPWQQHVLKGSLGERADGSWSAFEVGLIVPRQNGKGSILEARELAGLFLFGERLIIHSAHLFDTSLEAFNRILQLVEQTPDLDRRVKRVSHSHGEEGIELKNGCRLRFKARTKGGGRGFSGDLVILDEAYNLTADSMAALFPTLSARPNPQIWYTSSAGMESSDQLKRVRERGLAGESGRLAFFEWSCEAGQDTSDRDAWARANPALGYRITEEFVASEREAMPEIEFARERLGVWFDATLDTVIDMDTWALRADSASQLGDPAMFALDAAPDRSSACIGAAGYRDDGLVHGEVVEHRPKMGWVVERCKQLNERWQPEAFRLDPGSAAGALIPDLEAAGIPLELVTATSVGQACGLFYDLVVENKLRHLNQSSLNTALAGAAKRPLRDAWAWSRKDSLIDICPLVAVTHAVHGAVEHFSADDGGPNLW